MQLPERIDLLVDRSGAGNRLVEEIATHAISADFGDIVFQHRLLGVELRYDSGAGFIRGFVEETGHGSVDATKTVQRAHRAIGDFHALLQQARGIKAHQSYCRDRQNERQHKGHHLSGNRKPGQNLVDQDAPSRTGGNTAPPTHAMPARAPAPASLHSVDKSCRKSIKVRLSPTARPMGQSCICPAMT